MDKAMWDKLAAAGGIVGVALYVVGMIIYGSPPAVDDSASTVAEFFSDDRSRLLWATFLLGLGVLAILWFVAALVTTMRDAGEARLAAAGFGSFLIVISVGAVSALTRMALAFSVADESPDLALPLYHVSLIVDMMSGLFFAGLLAAVCGATLRTGIFPRWWGWGSGLAALWMIVGSTAWSRDGFWSPDGAGFVSLIVFLAWILVTSILLTMRMRESSSTA